MKESDIVAATIRRYTSANSRLWRNNRGIATYGGSMKICPRCGFSARGVSSHVRYGIPSAKGGADLIGIGEGGRFVAVECKTQRRRMGEGQREFLELIARLGGVAIIAYPDGEEEVEA